MFTISPQSFLFLGRLTAMCGSRNLLYHSRDGYRENLIERMAGDQSLGAD